MSTRTDGSLMFRRVPVLLKPPKQTIAVALPSALHIGLSSTLSVLILGIINAAVTLGLGPENQWSKLVQSGTMMAMVTVCILAMPNLGNSVVKGVQRITGVMIGGWLFYGLYAGCQLWWFLAVCLAVWAFGLVAVSFLLTGNQYLSPVALITAFIVATNFDSVERALTMTAVKTVAIAGSIVLYMLISMLAFPITATQQVLIALSEALDGLHQLSEQLLITGSSTDDTSELTAPKSMELTQLEPSRLLDVKDVDDTDLASAPAAAGKDAADSTTAVAASGPASDTGMKQRSVSSRGWKAGQLPVDSRSAMLASSIAHNLQLAEQLLPATQRECYAGQLGAYRCFFPSVVNRGLDEGKCMAVLLAASQVLRSLLLMMAGYGAVPLVQRPPPPHLLDPEAQHLVSALAQHAVAAVKVMSEALHAKGPSSTTVPRNCLTAYNQTLKQLVTSTAKGASCQQVEQRVHRASTSTMCKVQPSESTATVPASVTHRWKQAAAAAAGHQGPWQLDADHIAAAFGQLLMDAVTSQQAQTSKWCSTLVLSRQLGSALAELTDTVNQLLPLLPGAQHTVRRADDKAAGGSLPNDVV